MAKETKKQFTGGCLCGAVRFVANIAKGADAKPHTCSCTMCQKHTGGLTVSWVEFAKDDISWVGDQPATYDSSAHSYRAFCKKCGSSLGAIDKGPTLALLLGVFDNPKAKELQPRSHSYISQRPKWWQVTIGK